MVKLIRALLTLLLGLTLIVQPAAAQSILRDAESEALLRDLSAPLITAAGLNPRDVDIVLINDPEINAFVAGGQIVYIHSGLIVAADNANEVQGVIAHELGHIVAGDVIRGSEGVKTATGIMLLSMLIGVAAMAAGGGDAGSAIMAAGQQAAMGKFLAFSRTQESGADQSGRRFLQGAGISGRGLITFFRKLQGQEFRLAIKQDNAYDRTHPLTGDRIAALQEAVQADPAWSKPTDPTLEARFQRIKGKLIGFVMTPPETLARYPLSDQSVPARYARTYAYHKGAYPDRALAETDALLATAPTDPYFLELKGQILLESGRPTDALPLLRRAVQGAAYSPLIATTFGHALIATENPANYAEAKQVLRTAVGRDRENPFAWYQLGVIYGQEGDTARAALATAERFNLQGQARAALANAKLAAAGLPQGSADWLRAQDLAMVSQVEADKSRKGRRGQP